MKGGDDGGLCVEGGDGDGLWGVVCGGGGG